MSKSRPKWIDISELVKEIKNAEKGLLERRAIFTRITSSTTASDKDKETATAVINQIDDIINDNNTVSKEIKALVVSKTKLKINAGIKEKDQTEYLSCITKIDTRLSATGSYDEMLLQRLHSALNKGEIK